MSATRHNYLDEARPPESPGNSWRHSGPEDVARNHISTNTSCYDTSRKNTRSLPIEVDFYYEEDVHNNNSNDPEENGNGCEPDFNQNRLENMQMRMAKAQSYCEPVTSARKTSPSPKRPLSLPSQGRFSHQHQDVEEALSSLLWQPYEYQRSSRISVSSDSLSTLSTSSSADLEESGNGARETTNNRLGQSPSARRSRDPLVRPSSTSCCVPFGSHCESLNGAGLTRVVRGGDEFTQQKQHQVEMHVVTVSSAATAAPPGGDMDMIPSNISSVVSANVVGLPQQHNHARHASMPVGNALPSSGSVSGRNTAALPLFPNVQHPRNASEPAPTVPPAVPERNNINCANIVSILNHQRHSNTQTSVATRNNNVSNVNVNFYRAVPVNVVSNVPTIQCVNTSTPEQVGNDVSNVHIVQAMPTPTNALQTTQVPVQEVVRTRTFTSTEAQTDDTSIAAPVATVLLPATTTREQRRRERRERRHQRRLNSANHQHVNQGPPPPGDAGRLQMPDILNSHMPPPYSTLPGGPGAHPQAPPPPPPPMVMAGHPVQVSPSALVAGGGGAPAIVPFVPGQSVVPLVQSGATVVPQPSGFRIPFPSAGFRRGRYSEEHPKSCCGLLAWRPGSLRWFIALIALVAVCCVLVGTALGAMRPAGRDHLTVSLLMIGVGIVLVTVSGVAWRLTSPDAPSCRALLGLGGGEAGEPCGRRFVPRLPPSYGRPHHPYAAMMYPEFQFRPPPPSYQASMQEYRLRLLLLDRAGPTSVQHAVSPPPTYRSHAGSLLRAPLSNRRDAAQSEYSCPPSYRSHTGSTLPPPPHSREHSLSLSESTHASSVNVVNILGNTDDKMVPTSDPQDIQPLRMLLTGSGETTKDANLVTIVQTHDQSPVIVTVSGSSQDDQSSRELNSEMEILAHL